MDKINNIKLLTEYDGTAYIGWQVQPNGRSVQGVIEDKLRKIAPDSTGLIAAGRTDAGVHALRQVACFRSSVKHPPDTIKRALNALLPRDIKIVGAGYCNQSFHPRFDAKKKTYTYVIYSGRNASPFIYRYVWRVNQKLNIHRMKMASAFLTGKHDFSSFRASGCASGNPVREIMSLAIKKTKTINFLDFKIEGAFVIIDIEANAFLRHMVRSEEHTSELQSH